jgi:two-component system, LuxR family, response regulator FixJ
VSDQELRLVHLVDDDDAIRRSVGFMLKTSGFQVRTYESGVELLKAANGLEPGCILLDIRMPGMSGLEVQAALSATGVILPVIIMTGHGDVSLAVQAMKAGAVDFMKSHSKNRCSFLQLIMESSASRNRRRTANGLTRPP